MAGEVRPESRWKRAGAIFDIAARVLVIVALVGGWFAYERYDRLQNCLLEYANDTATIQQARDRIGKEDRAIARTERLAENELTAAGKTPGKEDDVREYLEWLNVRAWADKQRDANEIKRAENPIPDAPKVACR